MRIPYLRAWALSAFFLSLTLLSSCGGGDDPDAAVELTLAGDNLTAPNFEPGSHEALARFTRSDFAGLEGRKITAVRVYLANLPEAVDAIVYTAGTNAPGTVAAGGGIATPRANAWNTIPVVPEVEIGAQNIWVGVRVSNSSRLTIVGCDPGPAVTGGDWYKDPSGVWQSFRTFTGGAVDINWNIIAIVE
jgi:hypothetical protein